MRRFLANPLLHLRGSFISRIHAHHRVAVHRIIYDRTSRSIRRNSSLSIHDTKVLIPGDGRKRLSKIWVPTGGIAITSDEDSHAKLIRGGFLRQAHSGIFHMLPLGRRVQDKLEALIDKYMSQLGASRLALSSISSEELWSRSGRLKSIGPELFRFQDRKDARYILSPTHEEEITSLVAATVTSYKDLPVRLYQISRKYRDELRPRHGLLRTREFVMKDLYTFDYAPSLALETYHQVREVYTRLFNELKLPYLVAEADSGNMGGNLSHEFHFPTPKGEDHVISCTACDYVANEELAESAMSDDFLAGTNESTGDGALETMQADVRIWHGITRDRSTLVNVWYSSHHGRNTSYSEATIMPEVNINAVKAQVPELDTSVHNYLPSCTDQTGRSQSDTAAEASVLLPRRLISLIDYRLPSSIREGIASGAMNDQRFPGFLRDWVAMAEKKTLVNDPITQKPLDLLRIRSGDLCPRCSDGRIRVQRAIELGHTFHLGTRYSGPLSANVTVPSKLIEIQRSKAGAAHDLNEHQQVPLQMGCHGIGVTRMIGAVAESLADEKGLNWPRAMAPFEVVIVPGKEQEEAALVVYDMLVHSGPGEDDGIDLILDDRAHSFPWRMKDADLVGYPVIAIIGRRWSKEKMVEIQCRRLKIRQDVHITEVLLFIKSILSKL